MTQLALHVEMLGELLPQPNARLFVVAAPWPEAGDFNLHPGIVRKSREVSRSLLMKSSGSEMPVSTKRACSVN